MDQENSTLGRFIKKASDDPMAQTELPSQESLTVPEVSNELDAFDEIDPVTEDQPSIEMGEEPNVVLAPSAKDQALTQGLHNIGMKSYMIPDAKTQAEGFYVDDPEGLLIHHRQFKRIKEKGQKRS